MSPIVMLELVEEVEGLLAAPQTQRNHSSNRGANAHLFFKCDPRIGNYLYDAYQDNKAIFMQSVLEKLKADMALNFTKSLAHHEREYRAYLAKMDTIRLRLAGIPPPVPVEPVADTLLQLGLVSGRTDVEALHSGVAAIMHRHQNRIFTALSLQQESMNWINKAWNTATLETIGESLVYLHSTGRVVSMPPCTNGDARYVWNVQYSGGA